MSQPEEILSQELLPEVILSEKAATVFKEACKAEEKALDQSYLRIGANAGGCSGYRYELDWNSVDNVQDTDVTFQSQGVNIVVEKDCLLSILGPTKIDYTDQNMVEQGFTFVQIDGGHQCGCGESFTAYKDLKKFSL